MTSFGHDFYVILESFKCYKIWHVTKPVWCNFLAKLYITSLIFHFFLVLIFHLVFKSFLNSLLSRFFRLFFLFSLFFLIQVPFPAMLSSSSFPAFSFILKSTTCGDEPMEISNEEKYDDTSHPVLSETHAQAVCIQRLEMVDYTHEELYIKRVNPRFAVHPLRH